MNFLASLLIVIAAEAASPTPASSGNVPWENYLPWTAAVAAVVVLWRTSESKNDKILAVTERVTAALENSNAALRELKDALDQDNK